MSETALHDEIRQFAEQAAACKDPDMIDSCASIAAWCQHRGGLDDRARRPGAGRGRGGRG